MYVTARLLLCRKDEYSREICTIEELLSKNRKEHVLHGSSNFEDKDKTIRSKKDFRGIR